MSWVATASTKHGRVQKLAFTELDNTPVSVTTGCTASTTRSGLLIRRSLTSHKGKTIGWNRSSWVGPRWTPPLLSKVYSQRNSPMASRSGSPSNACNTNTVSYLPKPVPMGDPDHRCKFLNHPSGNTC